MNDKQAYPLCWPQGRPRTGAMQKQRGRFKTNFGAARDLLFDELRKLGGQYVTISSNIPLRKDGLPSSVHWGIKDTGIAVYFTRKSKQLCFACDLYHTTEANLHAIALTINALRGISRWGTGDMMEQAFRGFTAIPERSSSSWHETLGVAINASFDQVRDAYRSLAKKHHPDVGGDSEMFRRVREAMDEFERTIPK